MRKLDAIIRQSQHNAEAQHRSPDQQREDIERWARANDATIVAEHVGLGRSGKTMHREDVDAALTRIRAGQSEGVIVAWLDRFSRAPTREALEVYDEIRAAGGIVVAADMAGLDPSDPTGEMALTVHLALNRMVWRKAAERYERNRREAIAEGKAIGGAPFGYRFADPTPRKGGHGVVDSRLVIDPEAAPIVRELFERKAAGATWLELARWLDEVAPKEGKLWARSTVGGMIKCRTYLGEVSSGEHVKANAHGAIITPALWRRAQNGAGRRTPRGTYLLSGLARCGSCGRNLRGSSLGRKPNPGRKAPPPRIYTCSNRACEARPTIVVDRLDAEVAEQFFARLDAFHVRAVGDGELDSAREAVEARTAEVEALAAVIPSHPTAVAAHQSALEDAEGALAEAEDRLDELARAASADGPDARQLRDEWPALDLAERRELLAAAIEVVEVRRAPHPGAKVPVAERIAIGWR